MDSDTRELRKALRHAARQAADAALAPVRREHGNRPSFALQREFLLVDRACAVIYLAARDCTLAPERAVNGLKIVDHIMESYEGEARMAPLIRRRIIDILRSRVTTALLKWKEDVSNWDLRVRRMDALISGPGTGEVAVGEEVRASNATAPECCRIAA